MERLIQIILVTILLYFFNKRGAFVSLRRQDGLSYMLLIISLVISASFSLIVAAYAFTLGDLSKNIKESLDYQDRI